MPDTLVGRLIDAAATTIRDHRLELDTLDAVIGDGDHGTNLARGLDALTQEADRLGRRPLTAALARMAWIVRHEVGGDSGRLYAELLEGMAATVPAAQADLAGLARMVEAGAAAVQEAGPAQRGDKTMLDVLAPVATALVRAVHEGGSAVTGARVMAAAAHGLHATTRLAARRGQAADLGAASTHHMDPGALSLALITGAVVAQLEDAPAA